MANYNTLKSDIQAAIYQNGENAITGQILQEQLLSMVTSLGAGYQYGGVATPSTNPGEPDYKVFYLAGTEGTYTNFGGIVVANEVAILYGSGTSWTKADTGIKFVSVSQNTLTIGGEKVASLNDFFNVNSYKNELTTAYTASEARGYVPYLLRKQGMVITYLTAKGWITEKFVGTDTTQWTYSGEYADKNWIEVATKDTVDDVNGISGIYDAMRLNGVLFNINGLIRADGTISHSGEGSYVVTPYIPVSEGEKLLFKGGFNNTALPQVAGYTDIQGNGFTQLLVGGVYSTEQEITIPSGITYVRAWSAVSNAHYLRTELGYIRGICPFESENINKKNTASSYWLNLMVRRRFQYSEINYQINRNFLIIGGGTVYNQGSSVPIPSLSIDLTDANNWRTTTKYNGSNSVVALVAVSVVSAYLYEIKESESVDISGVIPLCIVNLSSSGNRIMQNFIKNTAGDETKFRDKLIDTSIISSSQTILDGYITENGTVTTYGTTKHTALIAVPEGATHIMFTSGQINKSGDVFNISAPSYVNCYSANEFSQASFVGRSDNKEWASLTQEKRLYKAYELPTGTRYIAYTCSQQIGNNIAIIVAGVYQGEQDVVINSIEYPIKTNAQTSKEGIGDTTIHFSVNVNVNMDNITDETISQQDSESLDIDQSVIMLPHNYSKDGEPVPLFIHCHGANGYDGTSSTASVSSTDSQAERSMLCKYMCANGFAVMDTNGMPEQWCEENDLELCDNMGTPMAIQCYIQAYKYAIEHFNIRKDGVVIYGGSMGGLVSTNIVMTGAIPVRLQVASCPCLDLYNQGWLHPWYSPTNHNVLGVNYGFPKEYGVYVYDSTKVRGFNPIINKMQTFDENGVRISSEGTFDFETGKLNGANIVEYKDYPVMLKIWHCEDDPTVNYAVSVRQVNAIKNAGGMAYLRTLPSGGHAPMTTGTPVASPVGNTNYRGTTVIVYPAVEEMYLFVKRYF